VNHRCYLVAAAVVMLVASLILVSGCAPSLKVGWREYRYDRFWHATFTRFSGSEKASFAAEEGDLIVIDASLELVSGSMTLSFCDADGELIWSRESDESVSESISVTALESGRYRLIVEGHKAVGGFDVTWDSHPIDASRLGRDLAVDR